MKMLWIVAMMFLCLVVPAFAEVVSMPQPTAGDAVASFLNAVIFPVVTAFLMGLIGVILNIIRKKYKVEVSASTQTYLENLAAQAVARAEEISAQVAKTSVIKFTGREKLDSAIKQILLAAPKVTPEQADALVHAALAKIEGVGATGDKVIK